MKINVIINLKKILFLFLLIFPNKLYASFFEDLTSQIIENPKRLSYGVSVTDVNKDGKFDFVVTGFGYLNLALSYKDGKLINIVNEIFFLMSLEELLVLLHVILIKMDMKKYISLTQTPIVVRKNTQID